MSHNVSHYVVIAWSDDLTVKVRIQIFKLRSIITENGSKAVRIRGLFYTCVMTEVRVKLHIAQIYDFMGNEKISTITNETNNNRSLQFVLPTSCK